MRKNKREIKEKQMAAAIMAISKRSFMMLPDEEDFAEVGKLLCMAYENYPRFASFGLLCWRDYQRAKLERQFEEYNRKYQMVAEMEGVSRELFETMAKDPILKNKFEALFEDWKRGLKGGQ